MSNAQVAAVGSVVAGALLLGWAQKTKLPWTPEQARDQTAVRL